MFKDKPYCRAARPKAFEAYLVDLAQSVFVLSPEELAPIAIGHGNLYGWAQFLL